MAYDPRYDVCANCIASLSSEIPDVITCRLMPAVYVAKINAWIQPSMPALGSCAQHIPNEKQHD